MRSEDRTAEPAKLAVFGPLQPARHPRPISARRALVHVRRCAHGPRLRSRVAGHCRVRPALRRVGVLRCEDHRHLLPPQLPRAHAQTRERAPVRVRRRRAGGGLSRVQALPPRRHARVARVGPARGHGRARHAADRRRRRRPRGRARARAKAGICRAPRAPPARSRRRRRSARARPRPACAVRAHPAGDHRAARHRCHVRRRLSQRAPVQRHRAGGVRAHAQRAARPRAP